MSRSSHHIVSEWVGIFILVLIALFSLWASPQSILFTSVLFSSHSIHIQFSSGHILLTFGSVLFTFCSHLVLLYSHSVLLYSHSIYVSSILISLFYSVLCLFSAPHQFYSTVVFAIPFLFLLSFFPFLSFVLVQLVTRGTRVSAGSPFPHVLRDVQGVR